MDIIEATTFGHLGLANLNINCNKTLLQTNPRSSQINVRYRFTRRGGGGFGGKQAPARGHRRFGGRSFSGRGFVGARQHLVAQPLGHADGGHSGLEHGEQKGDEPQQHQL